MANAFARSLRKNMTLQEVKLWAQLRKLRPQGFHFRRQAPLEGYVLDFVCFKYRLIVEADGAQHGEEAGVERDARRDAFFERNGFRVLRFWNHEIDGELDGVVETILARAREHSGSPNRFAARPTLPARGVRTAEFRQS
jgi:very-short-patch-repair endonuclease